MNSADSLHRFIFENIPIRGEYVFLQESFQTIIEQHNYPEALRRLLGEALCVSALLSAVIKFNGRLTVQFRGKGRLKLLLAQCTNHFHLRGLAKWEGDLSYHDLMNAFQDGVLVIMLDTGKTKSNYQGIVAWRGNSLVDSIEGYFQESEQLPTKLWLTVNSHSAVGLLLQSVPAKELNKPSIEKEVFATQWSHINKLMTNFDPKAMLSVGYPAILNKLYPQEDIRIFPSVPVSFRCTCSRKKGEDAILLLGHEEAEAELKAKSNIVVNCDFCNKEYIFDRIDVAKIFKNKHRPASDIHLH